LTDKDRDNIRAFKLRMMSGMERQTFNQMRHLFRHKLEISSDWVILRRMGILSEIEPIWYDCCINSCIAFTGKYANYTNCPHCQEVRTCNGKPRRAFGYLPIIPRLQGMFHNLKLVETMRYRANYQHDPNSISDIFDSLAYRSLCQTAVTVDGKKLRHHYFSNSEDLALSVCTDAFLLFKRHRSGPSGTPILVKNYNLPPEIRTHLEYLICLGLVPGPKQPKEIETFTAPFDDECARLALGVLTFNALTRKHFHLHAYKLFDLGDIIAIEKIMGLTGHNGFCPCRSCEITGVRDVTNRKTTYYVPLTAPMTKGKPHKTWDPRNLPMRSHESFFEVAKRISAAKSKAQVKRIAKETGIKRLPAIRRVGSSHFGRSAPWEGMHIFSENTIPALVKLWSGKFKGLDVGSEDYEIATHIWEEIGRETAEAVQHIPANFVRVLQNIATDQSHFTAESWMFWFVYIAPIVLNGRFQHSKYYRHACDLADIIKMCLKFTITHAEIDELEHKIIEWVKQYERYIAFFCPDACCKMWMHRFYYQYKEERLPVCILSIHGLLHIPDNIRFCGPMWTTWTYYMERYCGNLQKNLQSRRHPWKNLTNRILHTAYLDQLSSRYDLQEELSSSPNFRDANSLSRFEHKYVGCKYLFYCQFL
jgi:hypothetical protein